jgi:hypothetical protein
MKKIKIASVLATALVIASAATAQEQVNYVQVGALNANYSEPSATFNNGMLALTVGHKFDQNLAIEAMAAGAVNHASAYWGNVFVTAKVSNAEGVYMKAQSTPSNGFSVYGKAGFTRGTVTASAYVAGYSASSWSSGTSPSYGAGAQFETSPNSFISIDYMSYYNKNNVKIDGPSVNFGFKY